MAFQAKPVDAWKVDDVVQFLQHLELLTVVPLVRENAVDGRDLLELQDKELLDNLSLTPLQLRKLRKGLAELSAQQMSATLLSAPESSQFTEIPQTSSLPVDIAVILAPAEAASQLRAVDLQKTTQAVPGSCQTEASQAAPYFFQPPAHLAAQLATLSPTVEPTLTPPGPAILAPAEPIALQGTSTPPPQSAPAHPVTNGAPTSFPLPLEPPLEHQQVGGTVKGPQAGPDSNADAPLEHQEIGGIVSAADSVTAVPPPVDASYPIAPSMGQRYPPLHATAADPATAEATLGAPPAGTVGTPANSFPAIQPAAPRAAGPTGVPPVTSAATDGNWYPPVGPAGFATQAPEPHPLPQAFAASGEAEPQGFAQPPDTAPQGYAPPPNVEGPPPAYGTAYPVHPASGIGAATQKLVDSSIRLGQDSRDRAVYAVNSMRGQSVGPTPPGRGIADGTVTVVNDSLGLASTAVKESVDLVKNLFTRRV